MMNHEAEPRLPVSGTQESAVESRAQEIGRLASGADLERRQTMNRLLAKTRRYMTGAIMLSAAAGEAAYPSPDHLQETEEAPDSEKAREVPMRPEVSLDLTGLDREATATRLRRMLETYPKGWAMNVTSISYNPQSKPLPTYYGMKGLVLAEAVHGEDDRDEITFFGSSLDNPREALDSKLVHEVAHTIDWRHDNVGPALSEQLRAKIYARLDSPNRYDNGYVSSIKNRHKEVENELKALEHWTTINEVYFSSDDPAEILPAGDLAIIEDAVAAAEPNYDRERGLEARREILDEMAAVQFAERLDAFIRHLPPETTVFGFNADVLKERLVRQWWAYRFPESAERQAAGRSALADFVKRWEGDPAARQYALSHLSALYRANRLARDIGDGLYATDQPVDLGLLLDTLPSIKLDADGDKQPTGLSNDKKTAIEEDFLSLVREYAILGDVRLQEGEYARLLIVAQGSEMSPDVIMESMGYKPAVADRPLKKVMNTFSFKDEAAFRQATELL